MASFKPIGQAPVREQVTKDVDQRLLTRAWQSWFETVRQNLVDIRDFKLTINPSSVSANSTDEQSFSTDEINSEDVVLAVNKPSHTSGVGIAGFRAGNNTLFITFINPTSGPVDPPQEDYLVSALKR